ncbi:GGDEF domain-containing protein [Halomonas sp. WWR20]
MTPQRLASTWLVTLVYATAAPLLLVYAGWHYLLGHYSQILLPSLLSLVVAGAAALRLTRHDKRHLSSYLVLISCYLLVASELPHIDNPGTLWIGLPPVLTLILLPPGPAMLLNVLLAPVWLTLPGDSLPSGDVIMHYIVLILTAVLPLWWHSTQTRLLHATDLYDSESGALSRAALSERLHAEISRAQTLHQPLSVIVIHLPQADMAREQFGNQLRNTLLKRFSQTIITHTRCGDILGRYQPSLFWLLLPNTTEANARISQERLAQEATKILFPETGPLELHARVSRLGKDESHSHFEQRLSIAGLKLMEPPS